jgi:hypothetical protein
MQSSTERALLEAASDGKSPAHCGRNPTYGVKDGGLGHFSIHKPGLYFAESWFIGPFRACSYHICAVSYQGRPSSALSFVRSTLADHFAAFGYELC